MKLNTTGISSNRRYGLLLFIYSSVFFTILTSFAFKPNHTTNNEAELSEQVKATLQQAAIARKSGDLKSVLIYSLKALNSIDEFELTQKHRLSKKLLSAKCGILNKIAYTYKQVGDYQNAIAYAQYAIDNCTWQGLTNTQVQVHILLAQCYMLTKAYGEAYTVLSQLLLQSGANNNTFGLANAYYYLGELHLQREEFQLAVGNYEEANLQWQALENSSWVISCYGAIAMAYSSMGNYEQAICNNIEARAIALLNNDLLQAAYIDDNIGRDYVLIEKYEEAKIYLESAYATAQKAKDDDLLNSIETSFSILYKNMEVYDTALYYGYKALQSIDTTNLSSIIDLYEQISDSHAALGKNDSAYHYIKLSYDKKTQLYNLEQSKNLHNLQHSFEIEKREQALALAQAKQKTSWLLLFGSIVGLVLLLVLLWLAITRYREAKKSQQLLQQKNQKIEQQNLLLAQSNMDLEQFAYVASHDLKEPVRMIESYAKLLDNLYGSKIDENGKEFLHYIGDAAVRMRALLEGLLAYSKVGKTGNELSLVNTQKLIAVVRSTLYHHIKINNGQLFISSQLPVVAANEVQLMQVLQNLISNAIKFKRLDTVSVYVDCKDIDGMYQFSIADNGIGMDTKHLQQIFQVFRRLHTHQEFEGSGVGLSICKKIIERHGGTIWATSTLGQGSTFYFTLPKNTDQVPTDSKQNTDKNTSTVSMKVAS